MKTPSKLLVTLLLVSNCMAGAAWARGESEASAVASGLVVVIPVYVSVAGSVAVANSFANISNALNNETRWTVVGMDAKGNVTDLTLKSQDDQVTLKMAVQSAQVQKADVRLNQIVTAKRLGHHSFVLECNDTNLGVVTDSQSGLVRSKKLY